jgi:arginine decarboxylase
MHKNPKYKELIEQTFDFPQKEFKVENNSLQFNNLPLMDIIEKYGTPLRLTYLPKIGQQIQRARRLFNSSIANLDYKGNYYYCYCTKSSHFSFVVEEALKSNVFLETSSAFDFELIKKLEAKKKLTKDIQIICNGYKTQSYQNNIIEAIQNGYKNIITVLDNVQELDKYQPLDEPLQIGMRIAAEEEPKYEFYTSRLGIRANDVVSYYQQKIQNNPKYVLKMLHFFIDTGIKDVNYYWTEFHKALKIYVELKRICPTLNSINLGGGMPIKQSLAFDFDYEYMINEIVTQIKNVCSEVNVEEPHIYTEFGSYTVGETGAVIFSVLGTKTTKR